jgi:predicted TIM-barrel fold metal-dependent hydrolase
MTGRIDVHHHLFPPSYTALLREHAIGDAGGREIPDWSVEGTLAFMDRLGITAAVTSVAAPGTAFLGDAAREVAAAREANDFSAALVAGHPERFGSFAMLPMPRVRESAAEARRALDDLGADGVVLLANSAGSYLGEEGQDELFEVLDERAAVAFVHPNALAGPPAPGVPPFAVDFLLDTTRAAYLLVCNGIRRRYPKIRFILSHAGGFLPYASHRIAVILADQTGRPLPEVLDELSGFYFDTAVSSTAAALPSLLAFAQPGHVLYGSDWPFLPEAPIGYFTAGLEAYPGIADHGIDRDNATALFPRLAARELTVSA